MTEERVQRRLAAILAADVVGYSRLMEQDERATYGRLRALQKGLFEPEVARHRGRIFKLMGDGLLAEFASAVDATECALVLQRGMAERNAGATQAPRIELRIGVNLGDVIAEGEDLYGEGVNVAARLQTLAEPGGICLSGDTYRQVKGRIEAGFEDLGERTVKNMAEPIRVYRVADGLRPAAASSPAGAAPRAERPAIAVLPFTNMSGDPEQEYFSDGITEDIITELSKFRELLVIARNSSFQFRGKAHDIKDVANKLGVQFVVEGSVRKIATRVRVTAQLIDASSTGHIWADRYDRTLEDIFEVQDEIVRRVAGAIPMEVGRLRTDRARSKPTSNLTAQDHFLKGRYGMLEIYDLSLAREELEKAVEIDPQYAQAHASLAWVYALGIFNLGLESDLALAKAYKHAELALVANASDPEVLSSVSICEILMGEHDLADRHSRAALDSNPNHIQTLSARGLVAAYLGRFDEAKKCFDAARVIDPLGRQEFIEALSDYFFMIGEYEKVLEVYRAWTPFPTHLRLTEAAVNALLGRKAEAEAALRKFHESSLPKPDPMTLIRLQLRMCARQEERDRWRAGFRAAGFDV